MDLICILFLCVQLIVDLNNLCVSLTAGIFSTASWAFKKRRLFLPHFISKVILSGHHGPVGLGSRWESFLHDILDLSTCRGTSPEKCFHTTLCLVAITWCIQIVELIFMIICRKSVWILHLWIFPNFYWWDT